MRRDDLLKLDETALVRLCRVDSFRGVGPGGQKRNKTESAVRVVHLESGLEAFDDTSRSQHLNKHHALQKLRMEMAMHLRDVPCQWEGNIPSVHSDDFPRWIGRVMDALHASDFRVSDAAAFLGLGTAKLGRVLEECPAVWQLVNAERERRNLPKLTPRRNK